MCQLDGKRRRWFIESASNDWAGDDLNFSVVLTSPRAPSPMSSFSDVLDAVSFDEDGLVPAIAQDAGTGKVLMMAYMTAETLRETLETGRMIYWSRSRQERWAKGATSGHAQLVKEARLDCDGDALLFKVQQEGGACHTGYKSCFYRRAEDGALVADGTKMFNPDAVYGDET